MKKLVYCDILQNNHLNMCHGGVNPSRLLDAVELENISSITGIRFCYKTAEGSINEETKQKALELGFSPEVSNLTASYGEKFYTELYFIGDIVEFEQVKHLFKKNIDLDKYKDKKFAISYRDGEVFDIRPFDAELGEVHSVQSLDELSNIYIEKTGTVFPRNKSK